MTNYILEQGTKEYKKMKLMADALELNSPHNWHYTVENTYLDYGAGIKWTTIICYETGDCRGEGSYQALSPREWDEIMNTEKLEDFGKIVEEILTDKFCPDRADKQY